jgi:hypothetical protein
VPIRSATIRDGSQPVSFQIVKSSAEPPGKTVGHLWLISPFRSFVAGSDSPPAEGTRHTPWLFAGVR